MRSITQTIQVAQRQRVARRCRSAEGCGPHCLVLASKKESLELAPRRKQHFAPSTHNTWLDYVSRVRLWPSVTVGQR
jgi:hypothetical protein